jgi:asparagine synthetase B (glutamine-hydrolysing)
MTALEKLNALQAGELDSEYSQGVSGDGIWLLKNGEAMNIDELMHDLQLNAAKVEVTKVVLDEYLRTGDKTLITTLQKAL